MADSPVRHIDEDGSIYVIEIVPPEGDEYGAKYHVDLVRASVDEYGLGREQRLTVGQHNSWMEAEEQKHELEDGLAENGPLAWGEDTQHLQAQPYEEDIFYMAVTYPPDNREADEPAVAHLLVIGGHGIERAGLVTGEREAVERVVDQLDLLQAEEGIDTMLEGAQLESEVNAGGTPTTPLFQSDTEAVRHVDGGGTAHWFAVVEQNDPESEPYELRYFRALTLEDGTQYQDSYPVMSLSDDDPASAWALPGLEMYLQKDDLFMAQQFAHDVADAYGQDIPKPLDLPSLDPRPKYYFGYGSSENNEPSLEAVKTWMDGRVQRFDTLTVGEYSTYDEASDYERELEALMDEKGIEAALNLAESMAVPGGYLDPERDDPRIFFEDDAPSDPFTTNRERELAVPSYTIAAISANGESFLDVYKEWGADDYERLVMPQPNWEDARDKAVLANEMLDEDRIQDAMHMVELEGVRAGVVDPDREDLRLFTQGPPDLFETLAQRLEGEINPYWNTEGEVIDEPEVEELVQNPYWRLENLPVNDPDGEPLGHAMHIVVYNGVEHDTEAIGTPTMDENESFRMLEMAHFETTEAADKFAKEFNGYLMPGLLEGPELAVGSSAFGRTACGLEIT